MAAVDVSGRPLCGSGSYPVSPLITEVHGDFARCVCVYCMCAYSYPPALKNPEVVAQRGGLSTILKSVIDCQLSRINEALITTILHLLNHPNTRQYVRPDVELEVGARAAATANEPHPTNKRRKK